MQYSSLIYIARYNTLRDATTVTDVLDRLVGLVELELSPEVKINFVTIK